jgi:hypothetical protein
LHGTKLNYAGIIGYIQADTFDNWFKTINDWISELASSTSEWSQDDRLAELSVDLLNRIASCESIHSRIKAESARVRLAHLWVSL